MDKTWLIVFLYSVVSIVSSDTLPDLSDTPQEEISVVTGSQASIDCVINNGTDLTVIWKFIKDPKAEQKLISANNVIITEDKRFSIVKSSKTEKDNHRWVLQIENAKPEDTGLYSCEVNSVPKQSVTRVLTVSNPKTFANVLKNYSISIADNLNHSFTECCVKEGVPSICNGFCNLKGILTQTPKAHIFAICYNHMPQLVKCLTDGRDHIPCCERENIPRVCHGSCAGKYTLTTALEHVTCLDYAVPTLSCIAQGIEILPPPPRDVTAEALNDSQFVVRWEKNPEPGQSLVGHYELNVTELHSFDPFDWSVLKTSELSKHLKQSQGMDTKLRTFKIDSNKTEFVITDLKESTMYEMAIRSINQYGSSLVTGDIRVVTHSKPINNIEKDGKKPISPLVFNKTASLAPNLRKCCADNGIKTEFCLNTLCEPSKAEEVTIGDVSYCAQYANITFKCLTPDQDISDCCEERGISKFCQHFCRGQVSKSDFRHFICLHYISGYSSCLLESRGLLPSEPRAVAIASKHQDWALVKWSAPNKLSETVIKYNVHLREMDPEIDEGYSVEPALRSPFLIDGLKPGLKYEIYLTAVNEHGISRSSSRVIFKTKEPEPIEDIELEQSDSTAGYNETACCVRAGIADICTPLCSYHMKITDGLHLGALCADHRTLRTLVRCLAGGRDHRPCCERRGVDTRCLDVCIGTMNESPFIVGAKCSKHSGRILQCMVEGSDTIPGIPEDLHATLVTKNSIHLQWNASIDDIRSAQKHITYQLRYSTIDKEIPPHPYEEDYSIRINISDTKTVLSNLKPSTRYSIYVVAVNPYGFSMPSLVLLVTTKSEDESDSQQRIGSQLGPPHGIEVVQKTTDSVSIKWLPPYYIPPDASLLYEVNFKEVNNKTDVNQEKGNITETYVNIIDINGLKYNTQYAVAIKAKTEDGLKSVLSETVIVWTDAPSPLILSAPKLEPSGPVIEGEMLTVRCDATGAPTPTISIYVNGILAKTDETRHLVYKLDYVQRNLTAISCQASNELTRTNNSIVPAQSHVEVRVRFAPKIKIEKKLNIGAKYGTTQMVCEYSGNPQPKIQFFRDVRNKAELKSGVNTNIQTIPHSTKPSTWIATFTIKRVTEADAGQYLCIAQNEYGREVAAITLKVEEHKTSNRSTTVCCRNEGVSEQCLFACKSEVDFNIIFNRPQCFSELNKFMFCAADGSDHRDCCQRRDVSRECLHWCAGYKVSKTSLCLLSSARDIVSCFREGNAVLPSAPRNIQVHELFTDNRVVVGWEKPEKNSEAVQWYNVYWKRVGSKDLDSDRTDKLEYELRTLDPSATYEFLVKSSNYYGTSSLADPLVINIKSLQSQNEAINRSLMKVLIATLTTILVMIIIGVFGYYVFKNYNLLRKFRSNDPGFGVSFENQGYLNDGLQLQDHINNNHLSTDANNNRPVVEIRMN